MYAVKRNKWKKKKDFLYENINVAKKLEVSLSNIQD